MTVAVIGGTGTSGTSIVAALAERGVPVRVLTRDAQRAANVVDSRAEIRQTDIASHDDIIAACRDADAVLLLTSHAFDMADLQLRIIRALRRIDTKIVKISGTSSAIRPDGPYACRGHWEVEQVLVASGQRYAILRPNAFMQTLIGQILLPAVRATAAVPNPIGDAGISFIDVRDIADTAAAVLTSDAWDGQTLVLTGPRSVTYADIAAALGAQQGRPVELRESSPAAVRAMMAGRGTPEWEAEHFEEMYEMFARHESEFVSDDVATVTGHAPRTVEAYLAEVAEPAEPATTPA